MPTIFSINAVRVVVYPNDHRPAHVHLVGKGVEAVMNLNCPIGPPELRENYGFPSQTISELRNRVETALNSLCEKWEEIHGNCRS
jgi:hypothetical protein